MDKLQTTTNQIEIDLDSWLNAPDAENIITPENKKTSFFSSNSFDEELDKIDEPEEEKSKSEDENTTSDEVKQEKDDVKLDEVLSELDEMDQEVEDETSVKKPGRPKSNKSSLVDFIKEQVENEEFFLYDDYDESKQTIDEYLNSLSEKELKDLYRENINYIKKEVEEKVPEEFFSSLPPELQYAAKYVADGGTDLKGLFKALSEVEEVKELDPENEEDQETIVRQYLKMTNFGTDEEIEEEILTWKDINLLEKKSKQFKPKLDKIHEENVARKLAEQERIKAQQKEASERYIQNVTEALQDGEINGIKVDKNIQSKLYYGLTQPQYSSISGRPTNLLGHLLEKYQFVEPNYKLIAEALWLLSDPEGYRNKIRSMGANEKVAETVRKLKTEQNRKKISPSYQDEDMEFNKPKRIPRQTNIFKR